MLETAMRLAVAAAVAIAVGLGVRALLLQLLPGAYLAVILMRATALCVVGLGTYVTLARVLGVTELSELEGLVLRELKSRFKGAQQQ
jgi:putative peptidoglycan lipid II flippase